MQGDAGQHGHCTADHGHRTPRRQIASNGVFNGRYVPAPNITRFPRRPQPELMILGPITVRSVLLHRFCRSLAGYWIGVLPNEHTNVIGLSGPPNG
jgi:hypothetical protein